MKLFFRFHFISRFKTLYSTFIYGRKSLAMHSLFSHHSLTINIHSLFTRYSLAIIAYQINYCLLSPSILFTRQCSSERIYAWVHTSISLSILSGSLIDYIILLPADLAFWLATKTLFPAEVVLFRQSEYQKTWKEEPVCIRWTIPTSRPGWKQLPARSCRPPKK